ncbi:MAG: glycosyltransferase family 39 protein [Chloroflexota bacterium]|nr:glycosyltransferase family 39 protein [Chloroflexota bacterium]
MIEQAILRASATESREEFAAAETPGEAGWFSRYGPYLLLAVAVAVHLLFWISIFTGSLNIFFNDALHRRGQGADFYAIYLAGTHALQGTSIYDATGWQEVVPYLYPYRYIPFAAYTLGPVVAQFRPTDAYWLWLIVVEALLLFNLWLSWRLAGTSRQFAIVAAGWLAFTPFYMELFMGQFSMVMVTLFYIMGASLFRTAQDHRSDQGDGTAIYQKQGWESLSFSGAWILSLVWKSNSALFTPLVVRLRAWRTLLIGLMVLLLTTLPYFLQRPDDWQVFSRNFQAPTYLGAHAGNFGLHAFLMAVLRRFLLLREPLPGLPPTLPAGVWIVQLLVGTIALISLLVTFAPVEIVIPRLFRRSAAAIDGWRDRFDPVEGLALWIAAYFLIYRDVWEHHYVMLLPALSLLWLKRDFPRKLLAVVWVLVAAPSLLWLFDVAGPKDPEQFWLFWQAALYHSTKSLPVLILWGVLVQRAWRRAQTPEMATAFLSWDRQRLGRAVGRLAPLLILLLGFALRLDQLGTASLWLDEMGQASESMNGLLEALTGAQRHHGAAPLDYLFTWLTLQIGHSEFLVRLPAVMFGTLTLALTYQLARVLFDDVTGLLAMLLLAISPFHLHFSQEARFYALFACLAVGSSLALVVATRRDNKLGWIIYTATVIAGLYSHYFMPLVVLVQGMVLLIYPTFRVPDRNQQTGRRWQIVFHFLLSCLIAAVAFLPWFYLAVLRETGTPRATPPILTADLIHAMHAGLVFGDAWQLPELFQPWLLWLYGILALLGIAVGLLRPPTRPGTLLATLLLILSPVVIVLVLNQLNYFFTGRQLLFLLPFYLLMVAQAGASLIGWISTEIESPRRRRGMQTAAALLFAAILILPLTPIVQARYSSTDQDWRGALDFVTSNARDDEVVLVPGIKAENYLRFYAPEWVDRLGWQYETGEIEDAVRKSSSGWILVVSGFYEVNSFLQQTDALRIPFGPNLNVYRWRPTRERAAQLGDFGIESLPENPAALASLARFYRTNNDPEMADQLLAQAASNTADENARSRFELDRGNLWRQDGNADRAIEAYRNALNLSPDDVEAMIRLGEQLLITGQTGEGTEVLSDAVIQAPDSYWARRLLGEALRQTGQPDVAAHHLQKAVDLAPLEAETYLLLGRALEAWSDSIGAVTAYERYLELAPESTRADELREHLETLRGQ